MTLESKKGVFMNKRKLNRLKSLKERVVLGKSFIETLKAELEFLNADLNILQEQIDKTTNELNNLALDTDVAKYIQLKTKFNIALVKSKRGVSEFAVRNNLKVDEFQQQLIKIKNNEKVQQFRKLSKELKTYGLKIESLQKEYAYTNKKLGLLNREIAQLEFKLIKNCNGREF